MNKTTATLGIWGTILFGAGLILGWQFGPAARTAGTPAAKTAHPAKVAVTPSARRVLYWVSPMDPNQRSDHPKKDSMNMAYVPVYASSPESTSPTGLEVDSRMVQTLGVRLVTVRPRSLGHEINTIGTITVDENCLHDLNLRVSGWVVDLAVRAVGDTVRRGQLLAKIYSPQLYAAQNEYLIARGQSKLLPHQGVEHAAAERLRLIGMSSAQIVALAARGRAQQLMSIRAPENGTVLALGVRSGGYVTPGTRLFELADLSRVWAKIALYSYQIPWVQLGDPVQLRFAHGQKPIRAGHITFLYPTLDPANRTVEGRITLANNDGQLRPGMYVNASIQGMPTTALAAPADAILHMVNADYVMVATGQGHFMPTQVMLGPQSQGWVAVRLGLKSGDRIAESAQFLLYAESQLQQIKSRMLGPTASTPDTDTPASVSGVSRVGAQP
ncbi:MAG: efflux RND transporter periplasmic adaptor subunit [Acidiferrobacterales bacterium]